MKVRFFLTSLAVAMTANVAIGQEMPEGIDANSDGSVTVVEFATYAGTRLPGDFPADAFAKKVDANGDGTISQTEFDGRREVLTSMMSEAEPQAEEKSEGDGAMKVGDMAADFDLQSIDSTIKLSDLTAEGKTVVVAFSRAHW